MVKLLSVYTGRAFEELDLYKSCTPGAPFTNMV